MTKFIATQSTIRTVAGVEYSVSANVTVVDEEHPLYREHPELFVRAKHQSAEVEQATRAPGEKRGAES